MKMLSIIVPAYNEEEVIELFYKKLKEVIDKITERYKYEIIFVDDGSKDNTLDKLKKLRENDKNINIISFSRNFGKEAGIYAGLKNANGDMVVLLDADLQHDPENIPQMIKYIEEGYDTVTTIRNRKGESKVKSWFSNMFYRVMSGNKEIKLKKGSQDFRMMTRQVVQAILDLKEYNRFSKGIFSWVGFKTKYIEVENKKRAAGKTKWNYKKLIDLAIDGITAFTTSPLRISTYLSIPTFLALVIYFIYVIIKCVRLNVAIQAFQAIILLILFFSGIQIILIGIMGEYLGRIFNESKHRPLYLVNEYNGEKEMNDK